MNLPTHMSGQFSGQVPNQSGTSMSTVPHQQNIMQGSGGQRSTLNMEPGLVSARRYIQEKIYDFLMRRQQAQELNPKKVIDIVRRLEEGLFKTATTKEEYMNIETLENRLLVLIKRLPFSNHNQQYPQGSTSVPPGTIIPNPGMPQSGNSSIMVPLSMDTMVSPAVSTGNFMPINTRIPTGMHNGSISSSDDMSRQVPNHSGTSLSVMPLQQNIMQSSEGQRNTDPGFVSARHYIQEKIHDFLMLRQPTQGLDQKKMIEIVRRLEEGLFKTATTKEEYMNINTLESRVQALIKSCPIAPPAVNTGNSN